jgi:hypothetical protein
MSVIAEWVSDHFDAKRSLVYLAGSAPVYVVIGLLSDLWLFVGCVWLSSALVAARRPRLAR